MEFAVNSTTKTQHHEPDRHQVHQKKAGISRFSEMSLRVLRVLRGKIEATRIRRPQKQRQNPSKQVIARHSRPGTNCPGSTPRGNETVWQPQQARGPPPGTIPALNAPSPAAALQKR
jgi:hypothetical protein